MNRPVAGRALAWTTIALGALALVGCPWVTPGAVAPPSGTSSTVAPTQTASATAPVGTERTSAPTAPAAATWTAQAKLCVAKLEEIVAKAEAGDRAGALEAEDKAYHEEYENSDPRRDLEVASRTNLPEEMFEGKMRNVVVAREDLFAQIRGAVKSGAPTAKVRSLVDELSAKILADASALDAQVPPR